MNSPDPILTAPVGAIPWYKSPVYVSAIVTIVSLLAAMLPKVATWAGLTNPSVIQTDVENALTIVGLIAGFVTEWKRRNSLAQPIVRSAAKAADHPATLANLQVSAEMAQAGIPPVAQIQAIIQATQNATK